MEEKLKHLEFIQNLIARFGNNCFLVKGWAVTLSAALFTLSAKDSNDKYLIITYLGTIIFWLLDGYYLSQERQYRVLFDNVAKQEKTNFSMNARPYAQGRNRWSSALLSTTLLIFYGALTVLPLLLKMLF